jgi:hypothetical protein
VVEQAIRLLSLASRAAARGELRSAAGRRIACHTSNTRHVEFERTARVSKRFLTS